jgi:hypothetical protein
MPWKSGTTVFTNLRHQQIEPSQGRLRDKERFSMRWPSGPYRFSSGAVNENSVGGMGVLVACDLNLHHYVIDFVYFGLRPDLLIHNLLNLRDEMAGLVAGAGSGLCDIFNAQGLEPMTSTH